MQPPLTAAAASRLRRQAAALKDRYVILEAMAEQDCAELSPAMAARIEAAHTLLGTLDTLLALREVPRPA